MGGGFDRRPWAGYSTTAERAGGSATRMRDAGSAPLESDGEVRSGAVDDGQSAR